MPFRCEFHKRLAIANTTSGSVWAPTTSTLSLVPSATDTSPLATTL